MKITLILCGLIIAGITTSFGQAKKPTIMVVPSDNWCIKNGFTMEFDNEGTKVVIPDYKTAFQQSTEVKLAVSAINGMMADRGFPLKDLEATMKSLESDAAEDAMRTSKSGAEVAESPIDILKKKAKADIIMELTWTVNKTGPKKSITWILRGLDSYTNKQVASAQGTGAPSMSAEVPVLIQEAVTAHIDNFNVQLQAHFDDMFANGREIILRVKVWDDWDYDLESEDFGDDELGMIIEEWMDENTQKGRYNTTDMTETMALFEQVRIPMYNAKGRALDARGFAKVLYKKLKGDPMNIPCKLVQKGLGRATIYLGGK
jgi:hypothetical protein